MAVDSRNKRFSLLGLARPSLFVLANPDGAIVAADRAQLLWLYSGYWVRPELFVGLPPGEMALMMGV